MKIELKITYHIPLKQTLYKGTVNVGVWVGPVSSRLVSPVQHVHHFLGFFSAKVDISWLSLTSSQKGLITYNRKKVFASAFQFNSNTKGRMILQAVIWRLFTSTFVWLFLTCMQINIRTLVQFWTARYAFGVYFNYNTWNLQLAYNLWQNNHFQFNLLFKTICHDNTSLDAEDFTLKKTLALLFFEYFSRCHRHSYHQ